MRGSVPADGTRISRNEAEDLQVGGWWKGRVLSRPACARLSHVHVASTELLKKLQSLSLDRLLCHYAKSAPTCEKPCDI